MKLGLIFALCVIPATAIAATHPHARTPVDQTAPAPGTVCQYTGMNFTPGAEICVFAHHSQVCKPDGRWEVIGSREECVNGLSDKK